jgi:hypothetical protein
VLLDIELEFLLTELVGKIEVELLVGMISGSCGWKVNCGKLGVDDNEMLDVEADDEVEFRL